MAICGREKPGGLAKATSVTWIVGVSENFRLILPFSARSRPVARLTASMMRGLRLFGSNWLIAMAPAPTATTMTAATAIRAMRRGRRDRVIVVSRVVGPAGRGSPAS